MLRVIVVHEAGMLVSKQILHARPHLVLQDIHVLLLFHHADHLVNAADTGGSKTSPGHDASPSVLDCFPFAAVCQLLSWPTMHVHSSVRFDHIGNVAHLIFSHFSIFFLRLNTYILVPLVLNKEESYLKSRSLVNLGGDATPLSTTCRREFD